LPPPSGARKGLPYECDARVRKGLPYKAAAEARKGLPYECDAGARKELPYIGVWMAQQGRLLLR
jgi:hypothetical protein